MIAPELVEPEYSLETPVGPGLTDRVATALRHHPHLGRHRLHLEATDGRIVLRGRVGSFFHKQMAQEALRRVEGVAEIDNQLEVE